MDLTEMPTNEKRHFIKGDKYQPPYHVHKTDLRTVLEKGHRGGFGPSQLSLLDKGKGKSEDSLGIYYAGDLSLVERRCIAVIGTRKVSDDGRKRANKFARELVDAGIVVVSGLAAGVDAQALGRAMTDGGSVIAVIGTPIDRAYPAANARLQEHIYRDHLLISQFEIGTRTYPSSFPERNRTMAAISDGSVIIEASESSGTLHQAAECVRLNRWLGISKSVVDDKRLTWPAKFLDYERCLVLDSTERFVEKVYGK
jgi:DNA processing protein